MTCFQLSSSCSSRARPRVFPSARDGDRKCSSPVGFVPCRGRPLWVELVRPSHRRAALAGGREDLERDELESPAPTGLPQRRCHGCGRLWTPGEGAG